MFFVEMAQGRLERRKPHLYKFLKNTLNIKITALIQVCLIHLENSMKIDPEKAAMEILKKSPYDLKKLLYSILSANSDDGNLNLPSGFKFHNKLNDYLNEFPNNYRQISCKLPCIIFSLKNAFKIINKFSKYIIKKEIATNGNKPTSCENSDGTCEPEMIKKSLALVIIINNLSS